MGLEMIRKSIAGLEDLHLDERIMQFISISNRILSKRFGQNTYLARSYAVTPMGRRSGLIQWIDQCVPLFTLYKRHQVLSQGYATRPTEMFYSKLIPKLNKTTIPTGKFARHYFCIELLGLFLLEQVRDLIRYFPLAHFE